MGSRWVCEVQFGEGNDNHPVLPAWKSMDGGREPGGLQSMGPEVGHDQSDFTPSLSLLSCIGRRNGKPTPERVLPENRGTGEPGAACPADCTEPDDWLKWLSSRQNFPVLECAVSPDNMEEQILCWFSLNWGGPLMIEEAKFLESSSEAWESAYTFSPLFLQPGLSSNHQAVWLF